MKILLKGLLMLTATLSSANDITPALNSTQGIIQDIDGNVYRTVTIGDNTWLAENLRTLTFQDGTKVNTGFIPDDDERNLKHYGRLYDWHDVTSERNICPAGWRVASDDDWKTLEKAIGIAESELDTTGWRGQNDIAITLKAEQPNTLFKSFDQSQVNKYKFSATPAGVNLEIGILRKACILSFG